MKFSEQVQLYRERRGLTKTELGRKMEYTPSYFMLVESGRRPPPPLNVCEKIANVLDLSDKEKKSFLEAALEERLGPEELQAIANLKNKNDLFSNISIPQEYMEALKDPVAVKALLAVYQNKKDIKQAIARMVEVLPAMDPEKRKAILRLCI